MTNPDVISFLLLGTDVLVDVGGSSDLCTSCHHLPLMERLAELQSESLLGTVLCLWCDAINTAVLLLVIVCTSGVSFT